MHQAFIDGRLEREIKGIEAFVHWEMSCFASILMGRLFARFHFQSQHSPQKGIIG